MEPQITFALGKFDKVSGTIPVTFTNLTTGQAHTHIVNAILNARRGIDHAATRARIEQVAAGVAHKFNLGLLAGPGQGS